MYTPARSNARCSATASGPKAADQPAGRRGEEDRCPPPAGLAAHHPDPGGGPHARYEQLRHVAVHARAEAFGLGLAVLTGNGLVAWTRVCAEPTASTRLAHHPSASSETLNSPSARPRTPDSTALTRELVSILAALALVPDREKRNPHPCPQTHCPK